MSLLKLLASNAFLIVNKDLAKKIGLYESIIISELISEYNYWKSKDALIDGFFYSSQENLSNNTAISIYHQREAMKNLESLGIIQKEKRGMPAKRYIKINEQRIIEIIENDSLDMSSSEQNTCSHVNRIPVYCEQNTCSHVNRIPVSINNNKNNNKEKNNKNTFSEKTLFEQDDLSQSSTKEVSNELPISKNKIMEKARSGARPVSLDQLIGERLSDLDNKKAAENRKRKQENAEKELTVEEKQRLKVKKARMSEAKLRTNNELLLNALAEYIDAYQFSYHLLPKETWKMILDDLYGYSKDEDYLITCVNHSILNGYRKIFKPNYYRTNQDFDNTRGRHVDKALHEMTAEEKTAFEESLAKDEDGNLMVF